MKNKRGQYLGPLASILLLVALVGGDDDRLHLKRADVLENITVRGQAIQILRGAVVITKGDVTLTCDRARYNEKTGQGTLVGSVKIIQNELTLVCDSLHHDSPNDLLKGFGNTHVWDPDYDLVADTLYYFTKLDSGSAHGRVRLVQESQVIDADILTYHKAPEADAASYTATGNVVITEGQRVATCGRAVYAHDREMTLLQVNPVVKNDGQRLSGQMIELQYRDEVLRTMYIPADAHVTKRTTGFRERSPAGADSTVIVRDSVAFIDDMTGKVLKGFFSDGRLDTLRLEGMATTLYHIFEDSVYQGNNDASGDTMLMLFGADQLEQIFLSGGARGKFSPDSTNDGIDQPIVYQSDWLDYDLAGELTDLRGSAVIDYGDTKLSAGFINVAWRNNLLRALPTVPGDSLIAAVIPTIAERGKEPLRGESLAYNLKTRHGRVITGRTKSADGFYAGEEIRNTDTKTIYIAHSSYTTCDLEVPHFHFGGRRMKMINNDKVISRPIVLYIAGIPVFALPLGIFPDQGGARHSGWIMPGYGENRHRGQYLDGMGYYWAPNDCWDSKFLLDFADKQGITVRLGNRYNVRYRFSGGLNLEFKKTLGSSNDVTQLFQPGSSTDYYVKWTHGQTMRKQQSLNVNATYQSNVDYNLKNGIDLERRLQQQSRSNLSYSKSWKGTKNSMGLNLNSTRDLMAEKKIDSTSIFYQAPTKAGTELNITTNTLPSISFRHGQDYFFKSSGTAKRWYHNVTWNYNASFNNSLKTYYLSEDHPDSTDQFVWNPTVQSESDYVLSHGSSISSPQKILKYITFNPSLSLQSKWVDRSYAIAGLDSAANKIIKEEITGFAARTTGSFSVNLNTQIYGLFPVRVGALQALRHTISPTLGFSYNPDFSRPVLGHDFGYFATIRDTTGRLLYLDRFAGTRAGNTSSSEAKRMTFSVNNAFQAKLQKGEEEIKLNLFTYNFSSGYNFVADEFKWDILSSSLSSKLGKKLNLDLRLKHDFYEFDEVAQQRINKIRVNDRGFPTPRLTYVSMSQSFNFSGKRLKAIATVADTLADTTAFDDEFTDIGRENIRDRKPRAIEGDKLWSTGLSFSYSLTNPQMLNEQERFQMNARVTLQVTKNWRIEQTSYFNLITRQLLSQNFSIHRDLHCWEMSLQWTPTGYGRGFYLSIHPKSPQLKDLEVKHKGGIQSRLSGY
ncbi:MAG: putative LPS assembly protein LptD [Candidatus Neomarinimicrobiota bacterium]